MVGSSGSKRHPTYKCPPHSLALLCLIPTCHGAGQVGSPSSSAPQPLGLSRLLLPSATLASRVARA